jgi:threonine dehydratase
MTALPTRADVAVAAQRIAAHVRRTPLLQADIAGTTVWLKLEQLQVTGSFKARGATNAVLSLPTQPPAVVAASGGNHGLAVAHAAAAAGIAATVVVPESVPDAKARLLAASGASVVRHGDQYAEAEAHARHLASALQAPFIHAYADPAVIAGQGTVALEILDDIGDRCDAVLVAVGGGGLISGCATACRDTGVRVVGVEPEGIPTLRAALDAGTPVEVEVNSLTASALGARVTGALNLAIAQEAVDDVVLVTDADILAARDLLWETCRIAVEPAGAAGLAAILDGAVAAEAPCIVLCGANTSWVPD